jgi:hypothetical protein
MMAVRERVQLMLDFAQCDLAQLRAGDWLNLREDLSAFLTGARPQEANQEIPVGQTRGVLAIPLTRPLPQEMTEEALHALQAEVRSSLRGLIPAVEEGWQGLMTGMASFETAPLRLTFLQRGLVTVSGPTRDAVLLTLGLLITQLPLDALLRCPECATVCFRNRNQVYCTRRCVNRVNQRSRRARKGQPA